MNYLPISGIILRHIRLMRNYLNRLLFVFYWPLLDILIWGFVGNYLQSIQGTPNTEMIFLLSILLWTTFGRIGNEIFVFLVEELWSYNIINIFASPIRLSEWLIGLLIFTLLLLILLISFLLLIISLFYSVPMLELFKNFIIFAPALLLSAFSIGFLTLSIVIYYGIRGTEIGFVILWFFMPFSGVFYPVETLPQWAQKISFSLPMTYVFTAMREFVTNQVNPVPFLIKSIILSLVYGFLFLSLFLYMFHKSKDNGLARLTD